MSKSKQNNNKKSNNSNVAKTSTMSPSAVRRERIKKAVVWSFVVLVVIGLILSMAPAPTVFTQPAANPAEISY